MTTCWYNRVSCSILFSLIVFITQLVQAQETITPRGSISAEDVIARCNDALENARIVASLTESDLSVLPVVLINNPAVIIAIDSAYSDERGWFFSAYASVMLPGSSQPVAFAARNMAFNSAGLSSSTSSKLVLVTTTPIRLNDQIRLELPADGHNYIEFNCDGFKAINLKGNFVFSDDLLEPDEELAPISQREVTASFEVNTSDLNDMMMAVNITPFKIKGIDDISFKITSAVADFSDLVNPPGLILPQQYQQSLGSDIQLWRGFYLKDLTVTMKYLGNDPSLDPTISAKNLLIDDLGVTGEFGADNLISLRNGSADGWPMAIDMLRLKLTFNKVTAGALAGRLNVPFLGNEPIPYTAVVEQVEGSLQYRFAVATTGTGEFNAPLAKITLDPGSIISLEKRDDKFTASAVLHGHLSVEAQKVKFVGIKFENLFLTSGKPYIRGGTFSTIGKEKSKGIGFPLSIDGIKFSVSQGQAALNVGVSLNLMEKGFKASTTIQTFARMVEKIIPASGEDGEQKRQEWVFDKLKFNDIALTSETKAFYLDGTLSVYDNDPTYGDGFGGKLAFRIEKIMKNTVRVTAYFGSKETYRYWHLDAYVPSTIPLGPVVTINGLMGGASYHMKRVQPFAPDFTKLEADQMNANKPQNTNSHFVPDEHTGMSFQAGITLVVTNDAACNADALFEIAFNPHGGLKFIQFTGSAFFFTPSDKRERTKNGKVPQAPVFANLSMLYDNDNDVFHANLTTYLNVAGILRGVGPNNMVGEAVIHVDSKDWYLYIGRPSQMFGVSIAGLATAKTYFMVGTQVEDIPLPPAEVQEIFDDIEPMTMRDGNSLGRGRGFATGAHFKVGFDSGRKLKPFYIIIMVGAGADIMLRDYGDARCEGRSGKLGIDGWYASGQAYVFLKGRIGIRVKGSDFDIVSVGAAALLQAKLPNPTWLKGQLGGRYAILGGLVKGKFNLKLVVGEQCEIIQSGSEIDDIKVIEDIKPDVNGSDVSVFTAPQVSFNTALDTEFSMMDRSDNISYYRIKLTEFKVTKNGTAIPAVIEWNQAKDVAILRTPEILPQQSNLKASVRIYWEKKSGNGAWEAIRNNGQIVFETRETTFTTGVAPDFIPEENVAYSYPVKSQYNFYVNETETGYLKLKMGQAYLFEQGQDGKQWSFNVKYEDVNGQRYEVPLTYNKEQAAAAFEIPNELQKQTIYKLAFVKRPVSTGSIDQNLTRATVTANAGEGNEVSVASNTLDGTITNNVEKDLYSSAFRTSQFGKFEEKMAAISNTRDLLDVAVGNIAVIGKRADLPETFDLIELRGKDGQTNPLVQVVASAENAWMKNYMSPMLYDEYPVHEDVQISWRDADVLGVKPLRAVKLINDQGEYGLTDLHMTSGSAPSKSGSVLIGYYLSFYSFRDFNDLRNTAALKFLSNWASAPQAAKNLLAAGGFVDLIDGDYPVELTYSLPGTNQVTYRKELVIKY